MKFHVKHIYKTLENTLRFNGITVWNTEINGPGVTFWRDKKKRYGGTGVIIVVGHYKTAKLQLFTLAHEFGHCMRFQRYGKTNFSCLPRAKITKSEEAANRTACAILGYFDPELPREFTKFYNEINRKDKRRKQFKIKG